jgi:tetratricopeptide (TPR) repeat protein
MMNFEHVQKEAIRDICAISLVSILLTATTLAQGAKGAPVSDAASSVQRGLALAERGHCVEAMPILKRNLTRVADTKLKYKAAIHSAQCAMSLGQAGTALESLGVLNREFPGDPQVLYITAHYCSQLAGGAARELAENAPRSNQAQQLDAEAFEAHGNWDKAAATYRSILQQYPGLPGIHYRLGRILLAQPATATTAEDAKNEFEAELKIDPSSAGAEFMLGDLARQTQQWDDAVKHFSQAAKLDAGFVEAYLGLGMALNAAGRYSEAIVPLEMYAKSQPENAAAHYQLAFAYARTGRKDDAARELALQRQLDQKVNKDNRR